MIVKSMGLNSFYVCPPLIYFIKEKVQITLCVVARVTSPVDSSVSSTWRPGFTDLLVSSGESLFFSLETR